ncbi:family 16 glycosylhydrolase [Kribbella sp. NPDC058245]|uniref:glycoside hydrolase family 16 protein n=1 Tax=Kribbella sp. NPDC058245 TaxID=3346399 RepID=UPI0036E6C775
MRRHRPVAAAIAAALASTALAACADVKTAPATVKVDTPLAITWQQEFNEPAGTRPSASKWNFDLGGEPTWGNEEWQYYTNRQENAATDGTGNLVISARKEKLAGMENCQFGTCDITSARITTKDKFKQAYGRFEARIKIPAGQGLWPAFWMMGNDIDTVDWPGNGEIDIMEVVGNEPGNLYGTIHGPGYSAEEGITKATSLPAGQKWADAFHVYSVAWTPNRIIWEVDGREYFRVTPASLPAGKKWVFDHEFYLLLNLAVGGTWPGPPNASTKFPAKLLVDYVRVYS